MDKTQTRLIVVERGLAPVAAALRARGYSVRELGRGDLEQADAVVVTGQADDVLGFEMVKTRRPVIRAEGRTAAEVVDDLERRLGRAGPPRAEAQAGAAEPPDRSPPSEA